MPSSRSTLAHIEHNRRVVFDTMLRNAIDIYIGAKKASVQHEALNRWTVVIDETAHLLEFELYPSISAFTVRSIIPDTDAKERKLNDKSMLKDILIALISIGAVNAPIPAIRL
jgi:hypothetical protein